MPARLAPPANDDRPPGRAGTAPPRPTRTQRRWLRRGLDQPGGKLPLFDENGQRMGRRTIKACLDAGWAEPWFDNPLKPDWLVCRLTDAGRRAVGGDPTKSRNKHAPAPGENDTES
ncbi:MAG: hypothetical protein RID91_02325 [Azospirillaceae bacterium]